MVFAQKEVAVVVARLNLHGLLLWFVDVVCKRRIILRVFTCHCGQEVIHVTNVAFGKYSALEYVGFNMDFAV